MKKEKKELVFTKDLREQLKKIVQDEIKLMPAALEAMEPKERLSFVCKLMPFVFPKVDAVHHTTGENDWD